MALRAHRTARPALARAARPLTARSLVMCQRTNTHPPAHTRDRAHAPRPPDAEQALDQAQTLDQAGLWPCRRIRHFLLSQRPAPRPPQR
jgi:hypothetical protein